MDLVRDICSKAGNSPALFYAGEILDYKQLDRKVDGCCHVLAENGVQAGARVLALGVSPETSLLLLHGANRAGYVLGHLNPALPEAMLTRLMDDISPDVVISDRNLVQNRIAEADLLAAIAGATAERLSHDQLHADPQAAHTLLATSGSGGVPKVAVLSWQNLISGVVASRKRTGLAAGDRWLLCLPLFHIGGLAIPLRCAEVGAAVVLHPGFDAARVKEDLLRYQITHISLVPTMLARLLDEWGNRPPPDCLRVVLVGGSAMDDQLAARAYKSGWPIHPTYGMTETASQVAVAQPADWNGQANRVGKPLQHLELAIAPGSGLIRLRGPGVMLGYAGEQGTLDSPLVDGWLETRDTGVLDESGNLQIKGRIDDMLISGGENVYPQWVEAQLRQCPGVEDAAVGAVPDSLWGDRLVALFIGNVATTTLEDWARQHLNGAMRPASFQRVVSLPQTPLGKLDRQAFRQLLRQTQPAAN